MAKKQNNSVEIVIEQVKKGQVAFWIKGETPLVFRSMSAKVKGELLLPKGRKTTAEKNQTLKHDPLQEFRESIYEIQNPDAPTRCGFPAAAFKRGMSTAALEVPGLTKSKIDRLVWVRGELLPVYGVPKVISQVTRMADMSHTPDVPTKAIMPEWACRVEIQFLKPQINELAISRLLEMAGMICGIGDGRQEKGKLNFGQYHIADESEIQDIVKSGGRKAQDAALEKPTFYDIETERLIAWYTEERARRGK